MLSRVRLDPMGGVFDLRVYPVAGDGTIPLQQEMRDYSLAARVVISGDSATATVALGEIPPNAWPDFDAEMRRRGVKTVWWERHKRGKTILKKRVIR